MGGEALCLLIINQAPTTNTFIMIMHRTITDTPRSGAPVPFASESVVRWEVERRPWWPPCAGRWLQR